jgi:hypothetical protein
MRACLDPAAANTAAAHKLAAIIYHLLKYKEEYIDVARGVYEENFAAIASTACANKQQNSAAKWLNSRRLRRSY